MTIKQLKLTNNEEVVCEVMEHHEETDELVVRKILRVICADDYDQNIRYYSFRPWNSFQDDADAISVLNGGHIITETNPSNVLKVHWMGAWKEIEQSAELKRELGLDEIINEANELEDEDLAEFIEQKLREKEFQEKQSYEVDSATPNLIHFKPKTDTFH